MTGDPQLLTKFRFLASETRGITENLSGAGRLKASIAQRSRKRKDISICAWSAVTFVWFNYDATYFTLRVTERKSRRAHAAWSREAAARDDLPAARQQTIRAPRGISAQGRSARLQFQPHIAGVAGGVLHRAWAVPASAPRATSAGR